jgi:hypothetical protein
MVDNACRMLLLFLGHVIPMYLYGFQFMLYYNTFILLCAINSYLHIEHFHIYDVFVFMRQLLLSYFYFSSFCFEFYFYFVRALYLNFNLSWPALSLPGHVFILWLLYFYWANTSPVHLIIYVAIAINE